MQLCAKFGKFWAKIHREMIGQSWLLLTQFFNFPIVQCDIYSPLWKWSHWSVWLPPRLLFIGEKHASHQVQQLLDQVCAIAYHLYTHKILHYHGCQRKLKINSKINSTQKYVVFFQEVPGGWTTCWPLYWVLLLRAAWLWYGGYGEAFLLGRHVPIWGALNRAFHGLLTNWFVHDENGKH